MDNSVMEALGFKSRKKKTHSAESKQNSFFFHENDIHMKTALEYISYTCAYERLTVKKYLYTIVS